MNKLTPCFIFFLIFFVSFTAQETSIFDIARNGTLEELKITLDKNPNALNSKNDAGYSPLILACYSSNNIIAKYIVDNILDVNENSGYGTALMAASIKKNTEMVHYLLEHKAAPNISDANGTTALHYAVMFNSEEIIKILMKFYANPSMKDNQGNSALDYAKLNENKSIINLLKQ